MKIEQFYDVPLAHASYAIVSEGQMAVVDPARDPQPYYDFAAANQAKIVAVFETHPHADFISSHLEIAQATGAKIYVSKLLGADYLHQGFDDGDSLQLGKLRIASLNTPGHSPDSITLQLFDESGKLHALFTGDTLFVGDVGRPDLRETAGNITAKREELARAMYRSTREKLMNLAPEALVYPAHGAGSLCGKSLSPDRHSTLGRELRENYALQPMDEDSFVKVLLEDQSFIPKYFVYDVGINKKGAPNLAESLNNIPRLASDTELDSQILVVDTRPEKEYKAGHAARALNIQAGGKFETWLGSVIGPEEAFYLIATDEIAREELLKRTAKIGYETNVKGALAGYTGSMTVSNRLPAEDFFAHPELYTVVDLRNQSEVRDAKPFEHSLHIPLPELRERLGEIPTDKPIVVHCAAGYRSAAGCSILRARLPEAIIYDLSDKVVEVLQAN
jgi:hydroxyacylglutathione hydrolase